MDYLYRYVDEMYGSSDDDERPIGSGSLVILLRTHPIIGAVMNVDHIKPRKFFPELALDINNLQILCATCNHGKENWDMTDWR